MKSYLNLSALIGVIVICLSLQCFSQTLQDLPFSPYLINYYKIEKDNLDGINQGLDLEIVNEESVYYNFDRFTNPNSSIIGELNVNGSIPASEFTLLFWFKINKSLNQNGEVNKILLLTKSGEYWYSLSFSHDNLEFYGIRQIGKEVTYVSQIIPLSIIIENEWNLFSISSNKMEFNIGLNGDYIELERIAISPKKVKGILDNEDELLIGDMGVQIDQIGIYELGYSPDLNHQYFDNRGFLSLNSSGTNEKMSLYSQVEEPFVFLVDDSPLFGINRGVLLDPVSELKGGNEKLFDYYFNLFYRGIITYPRTNRVYEQDVLNRYDSKYFSTYEFSDKINYSINEQTGDVFVVFDYSDNYEVYAFNVFKGPYIFNESEEGISIIPGQPNVSYTLPDIISIKRIKYSPNNKINYKYRVELENGNYSYRYYKSSNTIRFDNSAAITLSYDNIELSDAVYELGFHIADLGDYQVLLSKWGYPIIPSGIFNEIKILNDSTVSLITRDFYGIAIFSPMTIDFKLDKVWNARNIENLQHLSGYKYVGRYNGKWRIFDAQYGTISSSQYDELRIISGNILVVKMGSSLFNFLDTDELSIFDDQLSRYSYNERDNTITGENHDHKIVYDIGSNKLTRTRLEKSESSYKSSDTYVFSQQRESEISISFCYNDITVTLIDGGIFVMNRKNQYGQIVSKVAGSFEIINSYPERLKVIINNERFSYDLVRDGLNNYSVLIDSQGRRYNVCKN